MKLLRDMFHLLFCWDVTWRVPYLAFFRDQRDNDFPATCIRCGSTRTLSGEEIQLRREPKEDA